MVTRSFLVGVLTVAVLATGGCLRKDTTSTWYLEADGRVVWTIEERDVRADDGSADERARLEADYLSEARQSNHQVARGLRQLTPTQLTVRVVRDRTPFHVITQATFPSLSSLGERLLSRVGLRGSSFVAFTRDGSEWTLSLDPGSTVNEDDIDEDFSALFDPPVIRVALAEGRFIEGDSGVVVEDGRFARVSIVDLFDDPARAKGTPTVFVLRWTTAAECTILSACVKMYVR